MPFETFAWVGWVGFKNNFAQVFSLRSSYAILTTCLGRLKVKDTLEGQMIKWS